MKLLGRIIADDMLKYHHGEENAVPSRVLEKAYNVSGREIRKIVNALRMSGIPICSGQTGYFYAKTTAEVKATASVLQAMANSIQDAVDGMMKYVEE